MDARGRKALREIKACFSTERLIVLKHFTRRMDGRGLFWPDIRTVVDDPSQVRDGGPDEHGRQTWILRGKATEGSEIELVCAMDHDEKGDFVVLITVYWDED